MPAHVSTIGGEDTCAQLQRTRVATPCPNRVVLRTPNMQSRAACHHLEGGQGRAHLALESPQARVPPAPLTLLSPAPELRPPTHSDPGQAPPPSPHRLRPWCSGFPRSPSPFPAPAQGCNYYTLKHRYLRHSQAPTHLAPNAYRPLPPLTSTQHRSITAKPTSQELWPTFLLMSMAPSYSLSPVVCHLVPEHYLSSLWPPGSPHAPYWVCNCNCNFTAHSRATNPTSHKPWRTLPLMAMMPRSPSILSQHHNAK